MKKHSLYEENKFERIRNLLYSNTAGLHDSLITYIEKIYGPELTPGIKAEIGRIDHNLDDKIESLISPSEKPSLSTSVVLPGLLLNTNAKSIEGNMLTWKPDSDIGLFIDFKMTAESRVTNTWTMIVTGLTAVILVLILLIPYRRGQTTANLIGNSGCTADTLFFIEAGFLLSRRSLPGFDVAVREAGLNSPGAIKLFLREFGN